METDRLAALLADLNHPDKPTLRRAVDELITRAADAPQIRELLNRRLSDPGHRNDWPVAYVLGHLPEPSGAAIRSLINALDHPEPDIRWACGLLLERIARTETEVIELLIELCRSGTANQKRMALYGLRDLELVDPASLQALVSSLSDADATVRVAAVTSLKGRSGNDALVRDELLNRYLNDADIKVRNAAAVTLAQIGTPSTAFLTALRTNLESTDRQAKKAAALALQLLEKRRPASSGGLRSR